MILQVTEVFRVEHLAQRVDQLTQVEVVGGAGKGREDTDQAHELAAYQVPLWNWGQRKDQVDRHDAVDDDDAHQ